MTSVIHLRYALAFALALAATGCATAAPGAVPAPAAVVAAAVQPAAPAKADQPAPAEGQQVEPGYEVQSIGGWIKKTAKKAGKTISGGVKTGVSYVEYGAADVGECAYDMTAGNYFTSNDTNDGKKSWCE